MVNRFNYFILIPGDEILYLHDQTQAGFLWKRKVSQTSLVSSIGIISAGNAVFLIYHKDDLWLKLPIESIIGETVIISVTFPDDLTVDQAYDAACEQDFQIADEAVAAVRAIEDGDLEEADACLACVLELNKLIREAAEIGELDKWIEYTDALENHTEEARAALEEGREWDAFEAAIEIPEMAERYLG